LTSEDLRAELDKSPFVPLRLHLVSGKTLMIRHSAEAWMLRNALLVLHDVQAGDDGGYDIVAVRNIERVEQLKGKSTRQSAPKR
jgi:hypothetical protein